ncbi:hypothetical protein BPLS_P2086 [Bathymodiolus platifrons methanotrophic gill symbiont]|nr:hypothetical protein BPLS_P2086 [Bathymodiolus platifrons methanotrophic gill symbiont]
MLDITEERKEEERRAHEARAEAERVRLAELARIEEEKRAAAEARANDYPELSLTWAKVFYLYRDEPVDLHRTFSYYPEFTGWHVFQTYGPTDTVMEIYHNGQSIVDIGKSDGDDGHDNNELQHKYLVEGERYVIQVYLQSKTNRGRIVLNVWAEEPFRVLSQKINICVKINCNLFLCDKWIKHHAGEKHSHPIIKITII